MREVTGLMRRLYSQTATASSPLEVICRVRAGWRLGKWESTQKPFWLGLTRMSFPVCEWDKEKVHTAVTKTYTLTFAWCSLRESLGYSEVCMFLYETCRLASNFFNVFFFFFFLCESIFIIRSSKLSGHAVKIIAIIRLWELWFYFPADHTKWVRAPSSIFSSRNRYQNNINRIVIFQYMRYEVTNITTKPVAQTVLNTAVAFAFLHPIRD